MERIPAVLVVSLVLVGSAGRDAGAQPEGSKARGARETASGRFDKDVRKKGCELLTAKLVAATFGVPESELTQRKVMGCLYTWKSGEQILEASVISLRAHKSEEAAARWFKRATRDLSQAEAKAALDRVVTKTKEHRDVDTEQKKKTVDAVVGGLADGVGAEGFVYEDVPGVGDEARMNAGDGNITVRIANLTFSVAAYQGTAMPTPNVQGLSDVKEIMRVVKAATAAWQRETLPQRRQDSTKLAKAFARTL